MRVFELGALCAATALLACAHDGATAYPPDPSRCDLSAVSLGATTATDIATDEIGRSIRFVGPHADRLKLWSVTGITGPCAGAAAAYSRGVLFFPNGRGLKLDGQAGPLKAIPGPVIRQAYTGKKVAAPEELKAGKLVMAEEAQRRVAGGHIAIRYVAIWTRDGKSLVGTFTTIDGGPARDVTSLIVTELELKSVSFFPGLDQAAGRLLILARKGETAAELIGVDWAAPAP